MKHQISQEPPEFSLDTGDKRSWQMPGQSVVQEYLRVSQVRAKELKVACAVRHFPGLNAQQSAIRFYLDTRDGKARLNPYADVEKIFSSKKHSLAALLKHRAARTDPYMANPYIDQDDAKTIAKSARQIRIRISQLGIINIALRGKGMGNDKDVNHLLTASEAWQKIPLQPTKTTVRLNIFCGACSGGGRLCPTYFDRANVFWHSTLPCHSNRTHFLFSGLSPAQVLILSVLIDS